MAASTSMIRKARCMSAVFEVTLKLLAALAAVVGGYVVGMGVVRLLHWMFGL